MEKSFMPKHDSGKSKDQQDKEQGDLMEAYLEREGGKAQDNQLSAEDAKLRSQEINEEATIGSNDFEMKSGTLKSRDDIATEKLREMDKVEMDKAEKPVLNEAEMNKIHMEALVENAKRDKNSAREAYVKSDYETSKRFARLKKFFGINMKTGAEGVSETQGEYEKYRTKAEEYKNLRVQELMEKYKSMTPEELAENKNEMDKELGILITEFNLGEKSELYKVRNEAMVKEREGKAWGKTLEIGNNLLNKYRKLGFKKQALISIALLGGGALAAATGSAFIAGGVAGAAFLRRLVGGLSAGAGAVNLQEAGRRWQEKRQSQKDTKKTLEDLEKIDKLDEKFNILSGKLQSEVDTFKNSLDTENRKSARRRMVGVGVGALVGYGVAGELMKSGFGWIGNTEAGKYAGSAWSNIKDKIPGAADNFSKYFAAGVSSEYGEGVVPSHGADVVYPKSSEHIESVTKVSNYGMEKISGQGGGISSEYGEGVVPSHGADVVYPESRPGGGMTQFEQDVRQSDLAKGSRPGSGMTQFEEDIRNSNLVKGKPSGSGLGETYTENSLKMDKGVKYGLSSEYGEGVVPSHGEGVPGKNEYYDQLKKAYDQKPNVDLSQKAPDLQNVETGEGNISSPDYEPIGKVSNIGMEQMQKINGIETAAKGDNVWNMIERQSHARMGVNFDNLSEAQKHNIIATLRNDMIKNIAADPEHNNYGFKITKTEIAKIGKLNSDPDKQMRFIDHILSTKLKVGQEIDFSNLYQDQSRISSVLEGAQNLKPSQIAEINAHDKAIANWAKTHPGQHLDMQKTDEIISGRGTVSETAEHTRNARGGKTKITFEKTGNENIPEAEKDISSPKVIDQSARLRDIEMKNNSLVAENAELQQKMARLSEQIKYDKQSLALGKDYPGQIRSGPSLKEMVAFREESLRELENQMAGNNAMIKELQKEYTDRLSNASPENVSRNATPSAEIENKDVLFQEKLGTVKGIRQGISGGNLQEWSRIQNQPASVVLKQPNSPAAVYYNYIVQENPRYVRYIRPHRNEMVINWTARLADYHSSHRGRFANFHVSLRGY